MGIPAGLGPLVEVAHIPVVHAVARQVLDGLLGAVQDGVATVVLRLAQALLMVRVEHEVAANLRAHLIDALALDLQAATPGDHGLQFFDHVHLPIAGVDVLDGVEHVVLHPAVELLGDL